MQLKWFSILPAPTRQLIMSNSPDVSPYVDLTLFDSSSQAIFEKALDYALVALPELQPREGSTEPGSQLLLRFKTRFMRSTDFRVQL
jgi:hypothetical protein